MQPRGIAFHHFHDGPLGGPNVIYPAGAGSLGTDDLVRLIRDLDSRRILPAHVFLQRAMEQRLTAGDQCLCFDDTLRCQYDLAVPVLEDFGLTAFWFINTSVLQGNIERPEIYRQFRTTGFSTLDDFYASFFVCLHESEFGPAAEETMATSKMPQAHRFDAGTHFRHVRDHVLGPARYAAIMDRMMDDAGFNVRRVARQLWMDDSAVLSLHESGHVIGLHSHTHPPQMAHLDADEQRYEYRANFTHLSALLGEQPTAMAHPCDSYNETTLDVLRQLNIRVGFRSDAIGGSSLELPRVDAARAARRVAA